MKSGTTDVKTISRLRRASLQPDMPIESIAESPLSGIYQVQLTGGQQLYVSADGQFVLHGYLYQFQNGQAVNLTEQAQTKAIAKQIDTSNGVHGLKFDGQRFDCGSKSGFLQATVAFGLSRPELRDDLAAFIKTLGPNELG